MNDQVPSMKALCLSGEFVPREGASLAGDSGRFALNASQVWRHPKITLENRPVPVPGHGELLIEVRYCGVCGTDVHSQRTDEGGYVRFSGPMNLPVVMGHEFSGVVREKGPGVLGFEIGDLVTAESILWCGVCGPCRRGAVNQCSRVELLGLTTDGAFGEYIRLPERLCWSLMPLLQAGVDERSALIAGALTEPIGCAYNGLFIAAGGFLPGATVAIYGAGPIGLGALSLCRLAGASKVVVIEPSALRRQLATDFGADLVLNPEEVGLVLHDSLRGLTGGLGFDLQVEAAGAGQRTVNCMQLAAGAGGTILYLGRGDSHSAWDLNPMVSGAHRLIGARGHAGSGVFEQVLRLVASGRLAMNEMVTSTFAFENVLAALQRAGEGLDGKVLVEF